MWCDHDFHSSSSCLTVLSCPRIHNSLLLLLLLLLDIVLVVVVACPIRNIASPELIVDKSFDNNVVDRPEIPKIACAIVHHFFYYLLLLLLGKVSHDIVQIVPRFVYIVLAIDV